MADPFVMRWKLDRPCLEADKPGDVFVLLTIEPGAAPAPLVKPPATHLILLVDVSGSMNVLVRPDPSAKNLGQGTSEGKPIQRVISDVPSRREMACDVVQKLVERLQEEDLFSLVAFDDQAHVLAQGASPNQLDTLAQALQSLAKIGGGETSMARAFQAVRDIFSRVQDRPRTRKLVLLTDGEDSDPDEALRVAQGVGLDFSLPIVAFGTGECKVAFLTELAKTSLAGAFNHIRDEAAAQMLFRQTLASQKNVQATNVQLQLWLSPDLLVQELYRTKPEILYVGDLQPDEHQHVVLRLEQMERGKAYEFLFRCHVPARPANQRFRIAKATLTYELPGADGVRKVETNIVIESSADPNRAAERSGDVWRVLARAEVQRQVLFLQAKMDLLQRGAGTPRDRTVVANLLRALITKFDEFGDQAMANQYRLMQTEFTQKGFISQEMLNRSLAASSRAEEIIVAQDIDF